MNTVEPVWSPSPERIERSNMTRFLRHVASDIPNVESFEDLYGWSVDDIPAFWKRIWGFCDVIASETSSTTVEGFDKMPGAKWFPGSRLNFAENLLRFDDDQNALVAWNENGRHSAWT